MDSVILIGYMGCGKSSLGRRLAEHQHRKFFDTDEWIERLAGCSIAEIFSHRGEAVFRQMETECLLHLKVQKGGKVIAVGGGLPLRAQNRRLLKALGTVIYLKATPETIWERVRQDGTRPLLQTSEPAKKIREMMQEREAAYMAAADRVIYVDHRSIEDVTGELVRLTEDGI